MLIYLISFIVALILGMQKGHPFVGFFAGLFLPVIGPLLMLFIKE